MIKKIYFYLNCKSKDIIEFYLLSSEIFLIRNNVEMKLIIDANINFYVLCIRIF